MHHQFLELADVDITKEPMEIGPTCHYVMGGVEVDPDTAAASVPGLFAAGEVSGGMHGSNRLGGNSLSDLLVFGKRAGDGAADYLVAGFSLGPPSPRLTWTRRWRRRSRRSGRAEGENPYTVHAELQQTMNDLVGLIRREQEVKEALDGAGEVQGARGPRGGARRAGLQPGLALRASTCGTCCWSPSAWRWPRWSAQESRGGHTREDYPEMSPEWRKVNLILTLTGDKVR